MTRKDYVALAGALSSVRPSDGHWDNGDDAYVVTWTRCVRAIGDVLAADNGRFDRGRFVQACMGGAK